MKKYQLVTLISAVISAPFAYAANTLASDSATETLINQAAKPVFVSAEMPGASLANADIAAPPSELSKKADHASKSRFLPIWGDAARARGYDLPEPFGVNVSYMNIRQNVNVESIGFSGLLLPSSAFDIQVGKTRQKSETETLRLDAWILPFMNVYGVVGYTKGKTFSKVSVGVLSEDGNGELSFDYAPELADLDFVLDFKGTTYGGGTTLVGGYNNWFGLVDINYTQTRFNILDGEIDAFTLSPRLGYRFTLPEISAVRLGPSNLDMWVGSMYQNVQQRFSGSLSKLNMPAGLQTLMQLVNQEGNGRFDVKQRLQSPWNVLVGARYEITRNFNITTEIGFADRNSTFVAAEYRF